MFTNHLIYTFSSTSYLLFIIKLFIWFSQVDLVSNLFLVAIIVFSNYGFCYCKYDKIIVVVDVDTVFALVRFQIYKISKNIFEI